MSNSNGQKLIKKSRQGLISRQEIDEYKKRVDPIINRDQKQDPEALLHTLNNAYEIQIITAADLGISLEEVKQARNDMEGRNESWLRRVLGKER